MHNLAVKLTNITKQIVSGDISIEILKGVDLEAKKGELLMITGPSGSGKTTLLSIIAGTLRPDSGEILVLGNKLKEMDDDQLTTFRKLNVGFIFQQFHLIKSLNCLENICIPLILNGVDHKEAVERGLIILEQMGLKGKETIKPNHLSGGEQQRIAIGRALIHKPQLLICDEPTSSLDSENGALIMKLLVEAGRSSDRCVVVVTHDKRIFEYADRILIVEDGVMIS